MKKELKDILIIEDDVSTARTISKVLESNPAFNTHIATGGSEGIQKSFTIIPDLVLCDIKMSDIDGYRVLRILRECSLTYTIPIIFISGKSEIEDIKLGMRLGVDDYITKPFLNRELITAVDNRLAKYERIIERSSQNFQTLLEISGVPIFTHTENHFLHINESLTSILEYQKQDLLEKSLFDIIIPEQKEFISTKFTACLQQIDNIRRQSITLIKSNGQQIDVTLQCRSGTYINGKPMVIASVSEQRKKRSYTLQEIEQSIETISESLHVSENISTSLIQELHSLFADKEDEGEEAVKLSEREKEVLNLTCRGMAIKQIAFELNISNRTVEKYRTNLLEKTNSHNVVEAILYAIKNQLIEI